MASSEDLKNQLPQMQGALSTKDGELGAYGFIAAMDILKEMPSIKAPQSSFRQRADIVTPKQELAKEIDKMKANGASRDEISAFARTWNASH